MHRFLMTAVCALAPMTTAGAGTNFDFFTDFEFTDTSGFFTLGSSPLSVDFINGEAKTVGAPLLYTSGLNAWMIDAGETGEIVFETPAALVDLWFRDQSPFTESVLTFYGPGDTVLAEFNGLVTMFQNVVVSDVGPITRITLQNNGDVAYTVIDDFGFIAIPAPGSAALLGLAGLSAIRRRRG